MNVFTFSEAGGHPANEDAFRVEPHPKNPDVRLVAVADGQGGRTGGAMAARLAVDVVIEAAGREDWAGLLNDPWRWPDLLRMADEVVRDDPEAGCTTLVAFAALADCTAAGASCGDTAVLLAEAGRSELLTARQFKNPPVGSGEATFVAFSGWPESRGVLLAMTDGVWKYAGWDVIKQAAGTLRGQELIDAIAARARLPRARQFQDDFTLVVLEPDG
jgi:hypothetical protein